MAELKLISAESVTEGHPDKVCDQISDAILDDMLAQDPHSHVAVETCATVGQFFVFGEVTSEGYSDIQNIVRSVVRNIGYTSSRVGLDADSCGVTVSLTEQSPEINQGVARLSGEEESKASREQRYERGRPRRDVRLCVRRDRRAYAVADSSGAPSGVSSRRSAQERRGAASSSGWQDAGDHRIRRR